MGNITYRLKYADYPGAYHGFNLKTGFFYGADSDGNPIATSGWEDHDSFALYTFINGNWEMNWTDPENIQSIQNLPQVNTESKLDFVSWLEEKEGISWEEWDENYSGTMAEEVEKRYNAYLYDGLPPFCLRFI